VDTLYIEEAGRMSEQLSGYVAITDARKHLYDAKPTVSIQ
jgi:hypothetical protein